MAKPAATSGPATEAVKGHSLMADAWKRLRRNRIAVISLVFVVLTAIAGFCSPLISAYVTHFSLDEQHTRLAFNPPGVADVSSDHPTYDGDASSFDAIDLDGDGVIACQPVPQNQLALPGLGWLRIHAPTLHTQVLSRIDTLDQELPVKALIAYSIGQLACPELDELSRLTRHFDFLFDEYDIASGDAEPTAGGHQPDGFITWKEFPHSDQDLPAELRSRGLAGPDAFRALDVNGDHVISGWEVTERTRYMRIDKRHLMRHYDADHDFRLTRAEYPGAPVLRVFRAGTDGKGRDVLTRLFYGARISMLIGLLATMVSLLIGVTWGAVAGFFGGRVDNIMMRIVDVLYGLPFMFIVILLIVVVGRSTVNLFIALGAVQWLSMARVIRGQVISLKNREFIEAARAIGVSRIAIIFRHLIRNTVGPVIVYSTLLVPGVILLEAFLSFLGLGVQPPDPSWGNMITEGATKFQDYTWLILWPGGALALTLFAMNFLGDGIRDALDPQMQKH
ncbi:MAG: ABC transporter permease [Deltaproteobacteria bacterium]|nr:ABC transporter permease [Deltaproteobacteria bacterium]MCB9785491.1 ABC transporter permease [Deltaproteobacteria bacterium]